MPFCYLQLSSTATTFDRIVATDVSGMGFRLLLDDVKLLYSTENLQKFQASSFVSQTTQAARVLPVFGQDYTTVSPQLCVRTVLSAQSIVRARQHVPSCNHSFSLSLSS